VHKHCTSRSTACFWQCTASGRSAMALNYCWFSAGVELMTKSIVCNGYIIHKSKRCCDRLATHGSTLSSLSRSSSSDPVSALKVLSIFDPILQYSTLLRATSTEAQLSTKVGRSGPMHCVPWPSASKQSLSRNLNLCGAKRTFRGPRVYRHLEPLRRPEPQ
jgi:hypothetical protein